MIRAGIGGGGDLVLGVDGAGQTTQAVVASVSGDILGRGLGPPSNYHLVGIENARRALNTAIEGALTAAHRSADDKNKSWAQLGIGAACFGLAGVNGPADEAVFASWLRELGSSFKFKFVNDSEM